MSADASEQINAAAATYSTKLVESFGKLPLQQRKDVLRLAPNELKSVMVFAPRLFPFDRRPITSLRHPRMSFSTWAHHINGLERKSKMDAIDVSDEQLRNQEQLWSLVGVAHRMSVEALHDEVESLRSVVRGDPVVQRAIRRFWQRVVSTVDPNVSTVSRLACYYLEVRLFVVLYHPSAILTCLDSVEIDFAINTLDRAGLGEDDGELGEEERSQSDATGAAQADILTYEQFELSLLELADNWTSTVNPAEYAAFLADLETQVFAPLWASDTDAAFQMSLKKHTTDQFAVVNFQHWAVEHAKQKQNYMKRFISDIEAEEELKRGAEAAAIEEKLGEQISHHLRETISKKATVEEMRRRREREKILRQPVFRSIPTKVMGLTTKTHSLQAAVEQLRDANVV